MKRICLILCAALVALSSSAAGVCTAEADSVEKVSKKSKGEIREVVFNVHLHCENCVRKVQENIAFEKGVKGLDVSLERQTVTIKYDASKTTEQVLKDELRKLVPVRDVECWEEHTESCR